MLRRTVRMWRARVARRVGVPLALLGLVTGFSPLASTVAAQAGTMQNYIVLYGGSAVPADAAASIGKAGGSLVYSASMLAPIKRRNFADIDQGFTGQDCYCAWQFVYEPRLRRWGAPGIPAPGNPAPGNPTPGGPAPGIPVPGYPHRQ